MSSQTIDNVVLEKVSLTEVVEKPFLKREVGFIADTNNGGLYSQNQVVFDTTSNSSNGKYANYQEGLISFPLVITLQSSNVNHDWNSGAGANGLLSSDAVFSLKNSHYNLVHQCTIEYSNGTVVEQKPYLNQYINFKLHTELSQADEELFGQLIGYAKDSSTSYTYETAVSPRGIGLTNNANVVSGFIPQTLRGCADVSNDAIRKRQRYFNRVQFQGKASLLCANENDLARTSGANTISFSANPNLKIYYYDCIIRLKDLSSFFENMPMVRGAVMKITLVLNNNVSFQVAKDAAGNFTYTPSTFQNATSLTNPYMISASTIQVSNCAPTDILTPVLSTVNIGSGSTILPASTTYTVTANLCTSSVNSALRHVKTGCRLYVPFYQFAPKYQELYLKNRQRTIEYVDLEYNTFKASPNAPFLFNVSTGSARMKRLILIANLSSSANASEVANCSHSPLSSPFWDNTVSPFILKNFNVSIAGNNIYPNQLVYSYQQFLNEMNAQQGLNAGLMDGLCSGRIGLNDYLNNYKYIVVDLSRRLPEDENVPCSVQVSGEIASLKEIEFTCFIEKAKSVQIDVSTGMRL